MSTFAQVRFGIKTGTNDFFYLEDMSDQIEKEEKISFKEIKPFIKNLGNYKSLSEIKKAGLRVCKNGFSDEYWLIENEFLKPVIKSPRELESIMVDPFKLKYKVLICDKEKRELKDFSVLKYIEWGERQKNEDDILWKDTPSVAGRKRWYEIGEVEGNTFWIKETNERLGAFVAQNAIPCDCRLYYANASTAFQNSVNSTVSALVSEVNSRGGLGEGARSLMVYEVNSQLIVNPDLLPDDHFLLEYRPLKSIFEECGIDPRSAVPISEQKPQPLPDRAKLDKVIFDVLDLDEEERNDVYRAVCQLVWNRLNKAQNV